MILQVVGWYHSHPGFGCWLSGVDMNTQTSFEQLNQRAVSYRLDDGDDVMIMMITTTMMMMMLITMIIIIIIGSSSDRPCAERERQGGDRCLPNDSRRQ